MLLASKTSFAICLTSLVMLFGAVTSEPAAARAGSSPFAGEATERSAPGPALLRMAAGDCSGAAARAESQTGGKVLSVSTQQQGGQMVCVVTVLVPAQGGERPRKKTVTIKP
ncbi:hypothetical protein [Aurantimonas sp. VKM B-3413]|uniref:hypothetical protein n=1 Tax=Aurantimonas sp. VKM B-3413 TaxID=2779401 RepID=UPI001E469996|nr:hypothetical protein [Aurantimonas sp. VKM B-3413]MCB8836088.1 hypothetical protein [Aurantimonas sp. VKM B-3413]